MTIDAMHWRRQMLCKQDVIVYISSLFWAHSLHSFKRERHQVRPLRWRQADVSVYRWEVHRIGEGKGYQHALFVLFHCIRYVISQSQAFSCKSLCLYSPHMLMPLDSELACRRRHWDVLEWLWFLNSHAELLYKYMLGDKDTFEIAFMLAGKHQQFHRVPISPGVPLTAMYKELRRGGWKERYIQRVGIYAKPL